MLNMSNFFFSIFFVSIKIKTCFFRFLDFNLFLSFNLFQKIPQFHYVINIYFFYFNWKVKIFSFDFFSWFSFYWDWVLIFCDFDKIDSSISKQLCHKNNNYFLNNICEIFSRMNKLSSLKIRALNYSKFQFKIMQFIYYLFNLISK